VEVESGTIDAESSTASATAVAWRGVVWATVGVQLCASEVVLLLRDKRRSNMVQREI